jgi:hypothetical protein
VTGNLVSQERIMPRSIFTCSIALIIDMVAILPAFAQSDALLQFRWHKGQALTYRVEHQTIVTETVSGSRTDASSRLNLVKRWLVTDVDAANVATLQLSLVSLRHEQKRTNGETLLFDSANLAASTPELREQMGQHIGKTVASLRVASTGRVVEVMQGVASRYETELPFIVVLPAVAPRQGLAWQRSFQVTLDPPLGTGEKHPVTQTYQITNLVDGKATIALTTRFSSLPQNVADQVPLLQKQPEGQAIFDARSGLLVNARLSIDKTLEKHQGEGSSYRWQSHYVEEMVPGR